MFCVVDMMVVVFFCLYMGCRCLCMGSVSVFVMQVFVSCVHPVAVLNAAILHDLQMAYLRILEDGRGILQIPVS